MPTQGRGSAAQILFNRLVRTWIVPEANARARQSPGTGPIPLRLALLVWEQADGPTMFLNDEVFGKVARLQVISTGPVSQGQQVTAEHIKGLAQVSLRSSLNRHPYIFVVQGSEQKFYVKSSRTEEVLSTRDFNALAEPLSSEGVLLTSGETQLSVYLDVIRNLYDQVPPEKKAAQQFFCNFRVGCGTGSSSLGSRVQKAVAREPLAVNLSKATSRSIKMRGRSSLHYSQRAIQRPHLLLQEKRPCQKPSEPRSRAAPYREPSLI